MFFVNQLSRNHTVEYGKSRGDFLIDGNVTVEVGGKDKSFDQIADVPNSYVFADEIEFPVGKKSRSIWPDACTDLQKTQMRDQKVFWSRTFEPFTLR